MCRLKYSMFKTLSHWVVPDITCGRLLYSCKATPMMIAKAMETWWQLITLWSIFYTYTFVDFNAVSVISSWLQCRPIYRYIGGVSTHIGRSGRLVVTYVMIKRWKLATVYHWVSNLYIYTSILQTGRITLSSTPDQLLEKPQQKIPHAVTTV